MGTTPVLRGKALLILPYFGSYGPWFPLYLYSLANQHTLDLVLVSDTLPPALPANARHVAMTFDQLRERASARLGTPVRLHRTRNVCDLRPAYGLVFEEFTQGYEYWGFGDEDVLYGDLDRMLAPHLDGIADVVVPAANGKSGHLTLLRNHARTNELAMRDPAYKDVLVSQEHWAYDETSWRWARISSSTGISSFTKIVKDAEARGELMIRSGIPRVTDVPRRGRSYVHDGRSVYEQKGGEILYYHWGKMRHRKVRWPGPEDARKGFAFDRYGFYDPELGPAGLAVRRVGGRLRELAGDSRRELSQWRAAVRARISKMGRSTVCPSIGQCS
jgi:uncharacterized protein DUF6625